MRFWVYTLHIGKGDLAECGASPSAQIGKRFLEDRPWQPCPKLLWRRVQETIVDSKDRVDFQIVFGDRSLEGCQCNDRGATCGCKSRKASNEGNKGIGLSKARRWGRKQPAPYGGRRRRCPAAPDPASLQPSDRPRLPLAEQQSRCAPPGRARQAAARSRGGTSSRNPRRRCHRKLPSQQHLRGPQPSLEGRRISDQRRAPQRLEICLCKRCRGPAGGSVRRQGKLDICASAHGGGRKKERKGEIREGRNVRLRE